MICIRYGSITELLSCPHIRIPYPFMLYYANLGSKGDMQKLQAEIESAYSVVSIEGTLLLEHYLLRRT